MSEERRIITQSKDMEKKKIYVDLMRFNSTKSVYLKEIVIRVIFLRLMYVVACSIVNVMIENIKIKTMFNSGAEINCKCKRLIDTAQLFIRQNNNIVILNVIDERARFFNVYKTILINIGSIIISIPVFVIKRSDYEFLFKKLFQRAAHMNFININDKCFEMILHSLNEEKRINFLQSLLNISVIKKKDLYLR